MTQAIEAPLWVFSTSSFTAAQVIFLKPNLITIFLVKIKKSFSGSIALREGTPLWGQWADPNKALIFPFGPIAWHHPPPASSSCLAARCSQTLAQRSQTGGLMTTCGLQTCMLGVSADRSGSTDVVPGASFGCSSGNVSDTERNAG